MQRGQKSQATFRGPIPPGGGGLTNIVTEMGTDLMVEAGGY